MTTKLYELSLVDTVNLLAIKGQQVGGIAEVIEEENPSVENIAVIITLGNEMTQLNQILKSHFEHMEKPIVPGAALADAE